jgi:hypothetical protein
LNLMADRSLNTIKEKWLELIAEINYNQISR